jgi:hypothetical protein
MAAGQLLADGDLRIGAVTLPAGTRVVPFGGRRAVAWMTSQPVLDVPRAWAMLSECTSRPAWCRSRSSAGTHTRHGPGRPARCTRGPSAILTAWTPPKY